MTKVTFRKDVEFNIPEAAYEYARKHPIRKYIIEFYEPNDGHVVITEEYNSKLLALDRIRRYFGGYATRLIEK